MQRKELAKKHKAGDASRLRVGIVASRFNEDITDPMLEGARAVLREWKVKPKNIFVARVYGSFEVPLAGAQLIKKKRLDALIAIGCIVKGETRHDEYLAGATMQGLMRVQLDAQVPVGLAVLTTNTLAQARARSRGASNHGAQAARAALEAALAVR